MSTTESNRNIGNALLARIETYREEILKSFPSPNNYDYNLRLFHGAQALIAFADECCVLDPRAARLHFATLDNAFAPHRAAEERRRWPSLSPAGLGGTGGGA
jgi:hypothetical protein